MPEWKVGQEVTIESSRGYGGVPSFEHAKIQRVLKTAIVLNNDKRFTLSGCEWGTNSNGRWARGAILLDREEGLRREQQWGPKQAEHLIRDKISKITDDLRRLTLPAQSARGLIALEALVSAFREYHDKWGAR